VIHRVETQLRSAGWHVGRSVDVEASIEDLTAGGYQVSPGLREFFREFRGLTVRNGRSPVSIDASRAGPKRSYS
jgi:hypothetical protein